MYYIFRCRVEIYTPHPAVTVASNAGPLLPLWDLSCAPCLFWFNTRKVSGLGNAVCLDKVSGIWMVADLEVIARVLAVESCCVWIELERSRFLQWMHHFIFFLFSSHHFGFCKIQAVLSVFPFGGYTPRTLVPAYNYKNNSVGGHLSAWC